MLVAAAEVAIGVNVTAKNNLANVTYVSVVAINDAVNAKIAIVHAIVFVKAAILKTNNYLAEQKQHHLLHYNLFQLLPNLK
jgi:hypothetical protein